MATHAVARSTGTGRASGEARPITPPRWRRTRFTLLVGDVAAVAGAALAAAFSWDLARPGLDASAFLELWPLMAAFPLGFLLASLYPGAGVSPVDEFRRLSTVSTLVYWLSVVVMFVAQDLEVRSRGALALAWLLTLVLVPMTRALLRHLFSRRSWWGIPAIVLGAGRTGALLIERLQQNPGLSLKVVACYDDDPLRFGTALHGVPVLGSLRAAPAARPSMGVHHALVAMPGLDPDRLTQLIRRYAGVFPHLVLVPNLFGMTSVGVDGRDLAGVVGLHVRQNLLFPTKRALKRVMDLVLLAPAVLMALPIIALTATAVIVVSPGNPFYAQEREGHGRRKIRVWKLRTMYPNADALLKTTLREDPVAKAEWERHYKLSKDPRVLPILGPLLRRASIDELPQLWNILVGEMSFVGPRPFPYYHIEQFDEEFRDLRGSVLPGLTGMWQVTSRSTADLEAQRELDAYYIRNWSLWLDAYLLARTPWAVLFGKGAY
jgi:Undecaprenyl-phosphate galactose phosphotransferase WbaP